MSVAGSPRRRPGEARQAILDAAGELFAQNGYHGTSIRNIANRASVSEALVFRSYQTKDRLFDEAINKPFQTFLHGFLERWRGMEEPGANEPMIAQFVSELYDFVAEHRDSLFALVVAGRLSDSAQDWPVTRLSEGVGELVEQMLVEAHSRRLDVVDQEVSVPATVGLVLASVLLDDVLYPRGERRPSKERIVRGLSAYAIAGVTRQTRTE